MVHRIGVLMLGFVALLGAGLLVVNFNDHVSGNYVVVGGGDWHYGPQIAQLQPDEACIYKGYEPMYPWVVYRNEFGTLLSKCKKGNEFIGVPLVQTVYVE